MIDRVSCIAIATFEDMLVVATEGMVAGSD